MFVVGETFGRVRGLINSAGERVKSVRPGQPAVVLGLDSVPNAGDELRVMETDAQAREVAAYRSQKAKDKANAVKRSSLEELFAKREPDDFVAESVFEKLSEKIKKQEKSVFYSSLARSF